MNTTFDLLFNTLNDKHSNTESIDFTAKFPYSIDTTDNVASYQRYLAYYEKIPDIISEPNYIGLNPKDNSVQYVKEFYTNSEYIRVAVKITQNNRCYVKTLHLLSTCNMERYIKKGTLKKLDNS